MISNSNIYDEGNISRIWRDFQSTSSDWKEDRNYLKDCMPVWREAKGNPINGVAPGKMAMEDLVSLECAPRGTPGQYEFL